MSTILRGLMSVIADIEKLNDGEAVQHRSAPDARDVLRHRLPAGAPEHEGEPL
jgi:hypothetical protein